MASRQLAKVEPQRELTLLELPYCQFTPIGLSLDQDIDFTNWERVGRSLCMMTRSVQWWAGDWLRFGEFKFREKYAQAAQQTGIDTQTLMNYAFVANAIPISRRRERLGWSHHAEVASLEPEEQEEILAKAEAEQLTVREVRKKADIKRGTREAKAKGHLIDAELIAIAAEWKAIRVQVLGLGDAHPLAFRYCGGFIEEIDGLISRRGRSLIESFESWVDSGVWDLEELVKVSRLSRPTVDVIVDRLVAKGRYEHGEQETTEGARGAKRQLVKPVIEPPRASLLALDDDDETEDL